MQGLCQSNRFKRPQEEVFEATDQETPQINTKVNVLQQNISEKWKNSISMTHDLVLIFGTCSHGTGAPGCLNPQSWSCSLPFAENTLECITQSYMTLCNGQICENTMQLHCEVFPCVSYWFWRCAEIKSRATLRDGLGFPSEFCVVKATKNCPHYFTFELRILTRNTSATCKHMSKYISIIYRSGQFTRIAKPQFSSFRPDSLSKPPSSRWGQLRPLLFRS